MRIAIIGSGISGLTCAYLLQDRHDIVVYEADNWIGGHTHTVDVEVASGPVSVDTGFIVYNDRTYPNFIKMMSRLGIAGNATAMSFSVHKETTGFEYCGSNLNGLFAQRSNLLNPSYYRMLSDLLRFNREAPAVLIGEDNPSLYSYLKENGYGDSFRDNYLLPMAAAIWSGPVGTIGDFPVQQFVRFFDHHGLLQVRNRPQWRVIPGGSSSYVPKLTAGFADRIRLNSAVTSVTRNDAGVTVTTAAGEENYEQVIFACHSDQALALLSDPSDAEREVLGAIPYQENDVVLHTDDSLLPDRRRAIAAWNYRLTGNSDIPATVTYHMNSLMGLTVKEDLCVTLNQSESIAPEKILGRWNYTHPVFNRQSVAAQAKRDIIDGVGRTHFCGAYWHNGFHEDGVRSALPVAKRFGGEL